MAKETTSSIVQQPLPNVTGRTLHSVEQRSTDRLARCEDLLIRMPGIVSRILPAPFRPVQQQAPARSRLFWSPTRIIPGRPVFLASSRIGRQLEKLPAWFSAIRTFACRAKSQNVCLVTHEGVSTDPFVRRAACLWDLDWIEFRRIPDHVDQTWLDKRLVEWEATCRSRSNHARSRPFTIYYFDPFSALNATRSSGQTRPNKRAPKQKKGERPADSMLIEIASQVCVLKVRRNGVIHRSIAKRLMDGGDTRLLMEKQLTPRNLSSELTRDGAIAWWLYDRVSRQEGTVSERSLTIAPNTTELQSASLVSVVTKAAKPIINLKDVNEGQFFYHWTRRRDGCWPDLSSDQYLDDLLFNSMRAAHGPLDSLCRILASRRLIATNELIRSKRKVVCWTEVPLSQFKQHRIFRPHLARWDFEPFGIAIRKERLTKLGAQRVKYANLTSSKAAGTNDQTYVHPARASRSGRNSANRQSTKTDWSLEREWRSTGDLNLNRIGPSDAFVFVKSPADANVVAKLTAWPIVIAN